MMRVRAVVTRGPSYPTPKHRHLPPSCCRRPRARILFESDRRVIDAVHAQISFTRKGLVSSYVSLSLLFSHLAHTLVVSSQSVLTVALVSCPLSMCTRTRSQSRRICVCVCVDVCVCVCGCVVFAIFGRIVCVGCRRNKWPGKTVARRVADRKRRGLRVDASNIVAAYRYIGAVWTRGEGVKSVLFLFFLTASKYMEGRRGLSPLARGPDVETRISIII